MRKRGSLIAFSIRDERSQSDISLDVVRMKLWVPRDGQEEGKPHAGEQIIHLLIQGGGAERGHQCAVETLIDGGDFLVLAARRVVEGGGSEGDE